MSPAAVQLQRRCPVCDRRYEPDARLCAYDGAPLETGSADHERQSSSEDDLLRPGAQVGDYRLEGVVGTGGMGTVYQAVHPLIGRRVAIKVLRASDRKSQERFVREARAVTRINHPGIVDIFNFGSLPDGRGFYVMELLTGVNLDEALKQRGPLSARETLNILEPVVSALQAAHDQHIAHRDLKPPNVFLVYREGVLERVKLLDFGVAKQWQGDLHGQELTTLIESRPGSLMGTPLYMAPELFSGSAVDWEQVDRWALSVMVYLMLTGELPFDRPTLPELLTAILLMNPPAPSSLVPGLTAALDSVMARALHKQPERRFRSLSALLEGFSQALEPGSGVDATAASVLGMGPAGTPTLLEADRSALTRTLSWDPDAAPAFEKAQTESLESSPGELPERLAPAFRGGADAEPASGAAQHTPTLQREPGPAEDLSLAQALLSAQPSTLAQTQLESFPRIHSMGALRSIGIVSGIVMLASGLWWLRVGQHDGSTGAPATSDVAQRTASSNAAAVPPSTLPEQITTETGPLEPAQHRPAVDSASGPAVDSASGPAVDSASEREGVGLSASRVPAGSSTAAETRGSSAPAPAAEQTPASPQHQSPAGDGAPPRQTVKLPVKAPGARSLEQVGKLRLLQPAPFIAGLTLEGRALSARKLLEPSGTRGVIALFWHAACQGCDQQLEALRQQQSGFKAAGVTPLLINLLDTPDQVGQALVRHQLEAQLVLHDVTGALADRVGLRSTDGTLTGMPVAALIDRRGSLVYLTRQLTGEQVQLMLGVLPP